MLNQQQLWATAMQYCQKPQMRSIIQLAQDPKNYMTVIQQLCNLHPNVAKQIDDMIGQGYNPENVVKQMLGIK